MERSHSKRDSSSETASRSFFKKKSESDTSAPFFTVTESTTVQRQEENAPEREDEEETLQQTPQDTPVQRMCAECDQGQGGPEVLQAKLSVGEAGDAYEQEADHVSEQVVAHLQTSGTPPIQTKHEARLPQITPLVMRSGEGVATASPQVEHGIQRGRGGGETITPSLRSSMEHAFGRDFSGVRVHTNAEADTLNRALNARAFTTGQDIYFKSGEYQPESPTGQRLLAHELTHVVQQASSAKSIQADFAIAPTTPGARVQTLSQTQIQDAITFNQALYTNATQIGHIRDVLGISPAPPVVDADFVNAVGRYQAQYGLTQDGKLDLPTADRLAHEITAESDYLRTGNQQSIVTRGTVTHTGAVGTPPPGHQGPPVGAVEVRTGEEIELTPGSRLPNVISIEYTGAILEDSRWLQFVWFEMTASTPAGTAYLSGSVPTSSGLLPFTTNPASPNWAVDSGANNPFYESDAASLRNNSSTTIFDAAGGASWSPIPQAVFSAGLGATSVTFTAHFETYLIQNNQAVYKVPYSASTTYTPPTTAGGSVGVGAIGYTVVAAGPATALPRNLRTILHNNYPVFRNIQ